jgi:hypothetical protein
VRRFWWWVVGVGAVAAVEAVVGFYIKLLIRFKLYR